MNGKSVSLSVNTIFLPQKYIKTNFLDIKPRRHMQIYYEKSKYEIKTAAFLINWHIMHSGLEIKLFSRGPNRIFKSYI